MSLLNASLAAGTLLVALPIVLHLIMRQRPKYLRFPALRFIQKRKEANRRKIQLRHWLLLALRCLAIGLFALALARPSITGTGVLGKEGAPIAAALVFDTSPRMEYRHENLTRLEVAQELADWLLSRLPPETTVGVIDSTGPQRQVFAVDHGAAQQQIERLNTSPAARPLVEAIVDAIHLVRSKPEYRHEVYVFTDLSEAAWDDAALRSLSSALGEDELNVYVVDVGVQTPNNVGIEAVRLASDVVAQTADVSMEVDLARVGSDSPVEVELLVEDGSGDLQKRGQERVDWRDNTSSARFVLSGLGEGTHQGVVRVGRADALAADNVQHFTIEVRPPPAVLLLAEDDRQAVFLRNALAPQALVEQGRARFRVDVVRFEQATGQSLASYAAVCLLDPPPLPPPLWDALASYANEGGGVAIFLGHHALTKEGVDAFNADGPQALLAAPLVRAWKESGQTYLSPDAYDHPALARLRRYRTGVPWQDFPVYKLWQVDETLNAGASTIVSFANGLPAILERPVGNGRAVTMTTPVSHSPSQQDPEPWNLLPVGTRGDQPWPFLALMQGLVGYLAGTGEHRLNYTTGETATLKLSHVERLEVQQKKGYVVFTPGGDALQRTMRTGEDTVVFAATDRPGNYRVAAGGRTGALKRGFSVNLPPGTSRLTRADPKAIADALGANRVRFAREPDEIEVSVGLGRLGRELFPWMIGALVLILAGEHVVANRFYSDQ